LQQTLRWVREHVTVATDYFLKYTSITSDLPDDQLIFVVSTLQGIAGNSSYKHTFSRVLADSVFAQLLRLGSSVGRLPLSVAGDAPSHPFGVVVYAVVLWQSAAGRAKLESSFASLVRVLQDSVEFCPLLRVFAEFVGPGDHARLLPMLLELLTAAWDHLACAVSRTSRACV
jgi:hypothetical protein